MLWYSFVVADGKLMGQIEAIVMRVDLDGPLGLTLPAAMRLIECTIDDYDGDRD